MAFLPRYTYIMGRYSPRAVEDTELLVRNGSTAPSMMDSSIISIHKEGKDPLDVSSYRPIALLNTDMKILAKILMAS